MLNQLLSRDSFRENALERDKNKCVICGSTDRLSVHHIIERRLFSDGGYYLNNASTLCHNHHIEAEQTVLSCEKIREAAKIKNIVLPESIYPGELCDKWGNMILPNGQRTIGPLFYDESVQKILAPVMNLFTDRVKYPRTPHISFSEGQWKDDISIHSMSNFVDKECVVTAKLDGECTTIGFDRFTNNPYCHARSVSSKNDNTRHYVTNLAFQIGNDIPKGWRICGESMLAKHTIHYKNLKSYFYVFSVWNDKNQCLSWDETLDWCGLLGLEVVPVLYRGKYDESIIKKLYTPKYNEDDMEGFVLRIADSFSYSQFSQSVCKYVNGEFRKKLLANTDHWHNKTPEKNLLAEKK